jgi:hypothetical protein
MDQGEIDLAVLSNAGSVQGFLEAPTALRIARESNDHAGLNRGLILITIGPGVGLVIGAAATLWYDHTGRTRLQPPRSADVAQPAT